ncbi:MBL fold metallo-hydrolase [Endozoicomonas sp. SM1973]|uniref:MBL fold metallo-hydrolase n=1 Tax=Spartinivicinus marinus TaxID=2994442 RepID=A0A853I178_9GAMM|nr:MBL fold metallo-hydrolase [Spartinivicinus marinus]MCX4029110.1 MBL fold metallo-hydrolase [Spartinivicinus marinus]NYZ67730.1 MBL fold metallo-hydrolase [Spartinivicinus marinus]
MLKYQIHPVTPFQQNCSLVICEATSKAALIDPGGETERLIAAVAKAGVTLEKVLLTHGHLDHVGATQQIARHFQVPVIGPHIADKFWLDGLPEQSQMFGFPPVEAFTPDQWLQQGDQVTVGEEKLNVLHCPGHTPGHVVFYHQPTALAFVGDVIFADSIGRTDFPQGNHEALIHSITQILFPLGDEVEFIPGHGPNSTFGQEKCTNPFVSGQFG